MKIRVFDSMLENDQWLCFYSPDIGHDFYDEVSSYNIGVIKYKKERFIVFHHGTSTPYVKVLRLKKDD